MHMKRHVSADREAHENDVFRALAAFVGYFRRKPSVICTNCTPLDTVSAGSTPGLNRVRKGKNPKIWRTCATVAPYLAASRPRSHAPAPLPPLHQRWRGGKAGKKDTGYLYKGSPLQLRQPLQP